MQETIGIARITASLPPENCLFHEEILTALKQLEGFYFLNKRYGEYLLGKKIPLMVPGNVIMNTVNAEVSSEFSNIDYIATRQSKLKSFVYNIFGITDPFYWHAHVIGENPYGIPTGTALCHESNLQKKINKMLD